MSNAPVRPRDGDTSLELLRERRLTYAGLTRDEDNLRLPGGRASKARPKLGERSIPANEAGLQRRNGRVVFQCWGRDEPSYEPIAAPRKRFNEARLLWVVFQYSTEVEDLALDGLRLDGSLRPHGVEELAVRYELAGALDQVLEDAVLARREEDAFVCARATPSPQALVHRVETERWELPHRGRPSTGDWIRRADTKPNNVGRGGFER